MLVKELRGVPVRDKLTIALAKSNAQTTLDPLLCGVEAVIEQGAVTARSMP